MSSSVFVDSKSSIQNKKGYCLNLSYQGLSEIPEEIIEKYAKQTNTLDLTYNVFKSLHSLHEFLSLHTIILDNNPLDEYVGFPAVFESVKLLSINANKITNLSVFVNRISQDLPNLMFLSMMKNNAAPSYFNGGTKSQNQDYRDYVICHFPKLVNLDGQSITDDERREAYKVYGKRWKVKKRTVSSFN